MTSAHRDEFKDLKRAWAPGRLSPPLTTHASILTDELEQQIRALGNPGGRQHFLIHGADPDATARLSKVTMAQLRETHPDLRIVRLNFQARLYGSIAGIFDSLISSMTGGVISADLAAVAKDPIKKIWKDKVHEFLTVAMQPKETGTKTKGVIIFADDYDALMRDVFDTPEKASLLRAFLQDQSKVVFVGVSKGQKLDSNPDDRIFRLFRRWHLPLPSPAEMFPSPPPKKPEFAALMATAQILGAYERPFTTAIRTIDWVEKFDLADLSRSLVESAQTQWGSDIEKLSSTRLAILQALIVLGEPATASELAERLNVAQSRIARHIGDMKDEAILGVQSIAGRSKPVELTQRGLALAIKGSNDQLTLALNVAAGRFLAGEAIDEQVEQLMSLPRAKRYARMKKKWVIKGSYTVSRKIDRSNVRLSTQSAFLSTLTAAYLDQCPDDLNDLREAAEAQPDHNELLLKLIDELIDPKIGSELKKAREISGYKQNRTQKEVGASA